MSNFIQRAITGLLFIAIVCGALILSPLSYAIIMTCIITLATNEYFRIIRAAGQTAHFMLALATNLISFAMGFVINEANVDPRILLCIVGLIWIIFLVELFSHNERPFQNIALTMLCAIYVGLPFALFNLMAFKNGIYDYKPIIGLFILCWVNDTGAYLSGVTLGKHKLYERISPKKTVEGFIGGILFTLGASYALYCLSDHSLWFCMMCGLIVSVLGTCGDLIESMFKRSVNIKDSGSLLPGHGGILDRFDAIMFVAPIISLLYYFFT